MGYSDSLFILKDHFVFWVNSELEPNLEAAGILYEEFRILGNQSLQYVLRVTVEMDFKVHLKFQKNKPYSLEH